MTDEQVLDDNGWVAMEHRNSNPAVVQITKDNTVIRTYSFNTNKNPNVSLAFVHPDDVPYLSTYRAKICCGKVAYKFHLASLINTHLWQTGNR